MRLSFLVPVTGLVLALSAGLGHSQNKANKDDIFFDTFDGVTIKGTYYPAPKPGQPVVMFLHKYGSDRTKGGWDDLATHLQEKGYNVLSFDFRGHGQSTLVKPEKFWQLYAPNRNLISRWKADRRTITYRDFRPGYFPALLHDIVAARAFLDAKNDGKECNTSNLIVIGAEEGATLGFAWIASEHVRRSTYPDPTDPLKLIGNPQMASDDIAGAIWLSFAKSPQVGNSHISFPYSRLISLAPTMRDNVPMWFAVGNDDTAGKADTDYMYNSVLRADQSKKQLDLTFKKPIANTKLRGAQLLSNEKLTTGDDIDKYLKKLVERRPGTVARDRDTKNVLKLPEIMLNGKLGSLGFTNFP